MGCWTENEISILEKLYPKEGYRGCQVQLEGRTQSAIVHKATRLGIHTEESITIGKLYNYLEPLYRGTDYKSPGGKLFYRWWCKCWCNGPGCKGLTLVRSSNLNNNTIKSCGCYGRSLTIKRNKAGAVDLAGRKFGRWSVLSLNKIVSSEKGVFYWNVECECGVVGVVRGSALVEGASKSCGCLALELISGSNSCFWQGGITKLENEIRNSKEYTKWRKLVFKRDNYTCQYSGIRGGNLQVHHIKPFYLIIKENNITTMEQARNCKELWNVSNGITLSKQYHQKNKKYPQAFHSIYGNDFTKEEFEKWLGGENFGR